MKIYPFSQSFSVIQWHPCLCFLERATALNLDFILPTNVLILLLNMYIALNKIWCCFAHFKISHKWFHIICNLLQFALFAQHYVGAIFPCGYSYSLRVCALQLNVWLFPIYFFILLLMDQLIFIAFLLLSILLWTFLHTYENFSGVYSWEWRCPLEDQIHL